MNVVAAALLGFEGVLITLIPDMGGVQEHWRGVTLGLLGASIAILLWCLMDLPLNPLKWNKPTATKSLDVSALGSYLAQPARFISQQLYLAETKFVVENHGELLIPKRRRLMTATGLFALAFAALGVGAWVK
ncbi:hypothetical protein [Streptomyces sp. NBC_01481]|uniref:hypothetical protein n=1 Tax=Streptomyces sp. NBC_01481 TaxID=2975869 RepID=UPI002253509F|nr:hypothetical protein [Streptomyces sp. NBC_01481]MCX4587468.1 hypothetical protein [Streptomyces sp. NBC_01481]